ncbi:YutD family protein [Paenibacillus sp. 1001270B_150601_E10]|uniref:YutD family protein n=1 Tax=Paenibacillus sp. 1001270B_150601_E10 TaxID=2787079 RepID=UPI00189FB7B3|nr:YutD family protein [Paenibacillus sp. 1001270B_150601_E10]
MIFIGGKTYELVQEHRTAWNPEVFRDRYSEVLDRYDYIVGDWGYNQLRLKGFFKDNHPKSTKDSSVSSIMDYINEYCNFGCAYFILEKVPNKGGRLPQDGDIDLTGEVNSSLDIAEYNETAAAVQEGISLQPKRAQARHEQEGADGSTAARAEETASRQERKERADQQPRRDRQDRKKFNKASDKQSRLEQDASKEQQGERKDRSNRGERQERSKPNRNRNRYHKSKGPKPQESGESRAEQAKQAPNKRGAERSMEKVHS